MNENELSRKIIGCAIGVHKELGPGLIEPLYEEAFCHELSLAKLRFERQKQVPIPYKGITLSHPLRMDLLIEDQIIVDNKAKSAVTDLDKAQLLSYLRLRKLRLDLLINFHVIRLVDGVHRIVNGFE